MWYIGLRAATVVLVVLAWNTFPTLAPPTPAAGSGALPAAATGSTSQVVVNEFTATRYVELRNVSDSTVDVGAHPLWLCGAGGVTGTVRVAFGQVLAPGEIYVIASSTFTGGPADQVYAGELPRGGAALLDPDYAWLDGVAVVADSPCGEGDPAPECPQASTARDRASTDSGRNAADFSCRRCSPGEPN